MAATPVIALALVGCWAVEAPDRDGPLWFDVEFVDEPDGLDPAHPAPFSAEATEYRLRIRAMGRDHEAIDWDGSLAVKVAPGQIHSSRIVAVEGGETEVTVELSLAYEELRIWFSDEGDDEAPGSFASGVAPAVHVARPTVAQVQRPIGGGDTSELDREYVPVRAWYDPDPRELIVTAVTNDGFYVTDFSDPPGSYNSLFVFNFSRPDGLATGDRLGRLSGIVSEFLGFTEMQFPTFEVESSGHPEGRAVFDLDPSIVCDDDQMEAWEATVVRVGGAMGAWSPDALPVALLEGTTGDQGGVTSDFHYAGDCANYEEYGQWPALLDGECENGDDARVTVVNTNTVPSFRFPECQEQQLPPARELDWIAGTLRHTAPANPPWVIDVRDCLDFPAEARPGDCDQFLERPLSGPSKAPEKFYRDLVTCHGVPYRLN